MPQQQFDDWGISSLPDAKPASQPPAQAPQQKPSFDDWGISSLPDVGGRKPISYYEKLGLNPSPVSYTGRIAAPQDIQAILKGESDFNPKAKTGSYVGVAQLSRPEVEATGTKWGDYLSMSANDQLSVAEKHWKAMGYKPEYGLKGLAMIQAAPGYLKKAMNGWDGIIPFHDLDKAAREHKPPYPNGYALVKAQNKGWIGPDGEIRPSSITAYYAQRVPGYRAPQGVPTGVFSPPSTEQILQATGPKNSPYIGATMDQLRQIARKKYPGGVVPANSPLGAAMEAQGKQEIAEGRGVTDFGGSNNPIEAMGALSSQVGDINAALQSKYNPVVGLTKANISAVGRLINKPDAAAKVNGTIDALARATGRSVGEVVPWLVGGAISAPVTGALGVAALGQGAISDVKGIPNWIKTGQPPEGGWLENLAQAGRVFHGGQIDPWTNKPITTEQAITGGFNILQNSLIAEGGVEGLRRKYGQAQASRMIANRLSEIANAKPTWTVKETPQEAPTPHTPVSDYINRQPQPIESETPVSSFIGRSEAQRQARESAPGAQTPGEQTSRAGKFSRTSTDYLRAQKQEPTPGLMGLRGPRDEGAPTPSTPQASDPFAEAAARQEAADTIAAYAKSRGVSPDELKTGTLNQIYEHVAAKHGVSVDAAAKGMHLARTLHANAPDLFDEAAGRGKETANAIYRGESPTGVTGPSSGSITGEVMGNEEGSTPVKMEGSVPVISEQGSRYHGTSTKIEPGSTFDRYQSQNLYGPGFYTTDDATVAKGYSKKGRGTEPTIYKVQWTGENPPNLINLEKPLPTGVHDVFVSALPKGYDASDLDFTKSGKDVYSQLANIMQDEGYPRSEAEDVLTNLVQGMQDRGYDGFEHTGGKPGKTQHNVQIYWGNRETGQVPVSLEEMPSGTPNTQEGVQAPQTATQPSKTPIVNKGISEQEAMAKAMKDLGITPPTTPDIIEGTAAQPNPPQNQLEDFQRRLNATQEGQQVTQGPVEEHQATGGRLENVGENRNVQAPEQGEGGKAGGSDQLQPSVGKPSKEEVKAQVAQTDKGLPGLRNLPDPIKQAAMERAAAEGITKQEPVSVEKYQGMIQKMGADPALAAAIAQKGPGKLTPLEINYLNHAYDMMEQELNKAEADLERAQEAGVSPQELIAAKIKVAVLREQTAQVIKAATHGSSELGRGLRMLKELSNPALSLNRIVRRVADGMGVPVDQVPNKVIGKLTDKYNKVIEAEQNAQAKASTGLPDVSNLEKAKRGELNTIVTKEMYDKAEREIRNMPLSSSIAGIQFLNPKLWINLVEEGAYHIERGIRTYKEWRKEMLANAPPNVKDALNETELRKLYVAGWGKLRREMMRGSELGPDVLTKRGQFGERKMQTVGAEEGEWGAEERGRYSDQRLWENVAIKDPDVIKARQALADEINKHIKGDKFAELARTSVLSGPGTLVNISAAVLGHDFSSPVSRFLFNPIMKQTVGRLGGLGEAAGTEMMWHPGADLAEVAQLFNPETHAAVIKKMHDWGWENDFGQAEAKWKQNKLAKVLRLSGNSKIPLDLNRLAVELGVDPIRGKTSNAIYQLEIALHDSLKTPAERGAAISEIIRQESLARKAGENLNDPTVRYRILAEGLQNAKRAKLLNDSAGATVMKNVLNAVPGSRVIVPIAKVPINLDTRTLETSPIGIAYGAARHAQTMAKGILSERTPIAERFRTGGVKDGMKAIIDASKSQMDPETARKIARAYRNGMLGTALFIYGANSNSVTVTKDGHLKINGHQLPTYAEHLPFLEAIAMGRYYRDMGGGMRGLIGSMESGFGDVVQRSPFMEIPQAGQQLVGDYRTNRTSIPAMMEKAGTKIGAGILIPQLIQQIAKGKFPGAKYTPFNEPEGEYRVTKNPLDVIKSDLPIERQTLPLKRLPSGAPSRSRPSRKR